VTSVLPSISTAWPRTSSMLRASRTPPLAPAGSSLKVPLPRPPAWICDLTTTRGVARASAPLTASSTDRAGTPLETGAPNSLRTALAWYSWMFMTRLPVPRPLAEIGREALAGLDEALHGIDRLLEHCALVLVELDLDDALDALGADHHRHADIE